MHFNHHIYPQILISLDAHQLCSSQASPPHVPHWSWDSSTSVVTTLMVGRPGFDFRQVQGFLLFAIAPTTSLGPAKPAIQRLPEGGLFSRE